MRLTKALASGSAPCEWGRLEADDLCAVDDGLSPTRVGSTSARSTPTPSPTPRPHFRGEPTPMIGVPMGQHGSTPREWGALSPADGSRPVGLAQPNAVAGSTRAPSGDRAAGRLIPACTGSTVRRPPRFARVRLSPTQVGSAHSPVFLLASSPAHPRFRWEHLPLRTSPSWPRGSSPRGWGAPHPDDRAHGQRWLSPHSDGHHSTSTKQVLKMIGSAPCVGKHWNTFGTDLVIYGSASHA
jgi:hypothetical protein